MEPEKDVIQYEVADNGICTIWLNRPHVKNCVSPQLLRDLEAAVEQGARAARSTNSDSTEEATPTMTDEDYEMLISLLRGSAAQAIVGRCTCCTLLWLPGRLTPLNSSFTYTLNREPIQWIRR